MARSAHAPLEARSPRLSFAGVPRHWFAGDRTATHVANAVNLLFPAGERFFVRSVHRFAARIRDAELKERVRGFSQQEGHHARAHEEWFRTLEAQGFEVERFLAVYQRICFGIIEKISPDKLALATTAAAEQFTALLARDTIESDIFANAAPALRELLMWHAAEELEHKSVAYDVLQEVAPGWGWRAAGMAMGATLLVSFWAAGFVVLNHQDRKLPEEPRESLRGKLGKARLEELDAIVARMRARRRAMGSRIFLRGIADYLRPGFHPDQIDDASLLKSGLAAAGLA